MISYSYEFPGEFEGILAHEFGHVFQGDNKLLLMNHRAFTVPALAAFLLLLYSIYIKFIDPNPGRSSITFNFGVNLTI